MRRQDREIADINDKLDIIKKCKVCRLGLSENNIPYIVPLNFGYTYKNSTLTLFFHSALEGKKLEIIKNNNKACFEIDCGTELVKGEKACSHGYIFRSVIGFGEIHFLDSRDDKIHALNIIMEHQTEKDAIYAFTDDELKNVQLYKMDVDTFTGKQRQSPPKQDTT